MFELYTVKLMDASMKMTIWRGVTWVLALGVALVSLRFLAIPVELSMPHMAHYLEGANLALYGHIIGGPVALALIPFQFWTGLRRRAPRVHRTLGYITFTAIVIGGLSALALLPKFLGTPMAALGFATLGTLWIGSAVRAVLAARARDFETHRRWMLRTAAFCFAAVTLRLIMPFLMAGGMTITETYSVTAWASWIPNLILVEWWLRRRG